MKSVFVEKSEIVQKLIHLCSDTMCKSTGRVFFFVTWRVWQWKLAHILQTCVLFIFNPSLFWGSNSIHNLCQSRKTASDRSPAISGAWVSSEKGRHGCRLSNNKRRRAVQWEDHPVSRLILYDGCHGRCYLRLWYWNFRSVTLTTRETLLSFSFSWANRFMLNAYILDDCLFSTSQISHMSCIISILSFRNVTTAPQP